MRLPRIGLALLAVLFAGTCGRADSPDAARDFFFRDGDVIVMLGDSITEQRLYSTYVELWTVCRFPQRNLTFRNVGIGGDRSTGGDRRFKRDVLAHKATVLTVDFGMNDGNYQPFNDKAFQTYLKGLQGIADQARESRIRVAWITPQPVEHNPGDSKESYNDTLEKFSGGVKEIAEKNGGLFVDQFHPYWEVVKNARKAEEKKGRITGGDAVHPGPPGQALMAASILKGMKFPRLVSSVSIAVGEKGQPEVTVRNCQVSMMEGKGTDGITFKRHDKALPFFPEEARSILKWAPLLEEMNEYGLKVTGLKPGRYEIQLGGKKVAEHSAEELGQGVNLAAAALTAGPIADQVKTVRKAVQDKVTYFHDQVFRGVQLANPKSPLFKDTDPKEVTAKRQALYEERMKKMPELDAAVRKTLDTRPYEVAIVPVKK